MDLKAKLRNRLKISDIRAICSKCGASDGDILEEELYSLIKNPDDRIGYNALWIFTHFDQSLMSFFVDKKDDLINLILATEHIGKRRLLLTLKNRLTTEREELRTDYLNFCLSKINSTDPYAIRALCLKEAYAQCRYYPELVHELFMEVEMMSRGELSPGLISARNQVVRLLNTEYNAINCHGEFNEKDV